MSSATVLPRRMLLILAVFVPAVVMLMDERARGLAGNSLLLGISTISIAMPCGCLLAWLLTRTNVFGWRVGLASIIGMLFLPLYLHAAGWESAFGQLGWFQQVIPTTPTTAPLSGWRGAIWVHAVAGIPWVTAIVAARLWTLPAADIEAAMLDAGPMTVFRHITLPKAIPAVIVAGLWVFVVVLGEMSVTNLFQVKTYSEELYVGYASTAPIAEPGLATRVGVWPGLAIVLALTLTMLSVSFAMVNHGDTWTTQTAPRTDLGRHRWLTTVGLIAALLILVGIPIGSLIYQAGEIVEQIDNQRVRTWSFGKAIGELVYSPWINRQEFGWSLVISNTASITAVTISIPLAFAALGNRWARWLAAIIGAVCMTLPGPMIGLGLIAMLNQSDWDWLAYLNDRTILAPWLAITVRCLPLVLLVVWFSFRLVPRETLEVARLDGVGPVGQLFHVVIPQCFAAIVCAWLVGLAIAIGDLAASILVVPPGVTTIAIRVFGLVHYGVNDRLAALCLWTIGMLLAIVISVFWLANGLWGRRSAEDRMKTSD